MKKYLLTIAILINALAIFAQTPTSFQYQAVLRDASGGVLANQEVEIVIAILQGSITGTEVFSETHSVTTNSFGLANLQIGSVNQAEMEAMDWGAGPYFVQVSVDGTIMGTSQLLSVPYALYSKSVENDLVDDADADPANELQDLSLLGTELSISEGSAVDLSVLQDGIGTDNQKLRFTNNKYLEITNGNTVRLPFLYKEDDGDPENELQTLTKSGLEISLNQNGGTIRDSILTEAQVDAMVANNGYQLSADDYDTDSDNEIQTISKNGLLFTLNKSGGTVRDSILTEPQVDAMVANNGYQLSADDMDTNPTNEIQLLSISNDTIYLVNGGFVKLPFETDPIFSAWDKSSGIAISESQITDLKHFTNADETDPVYSADSLFLKAGVESWNSSLAKQITASDTTRWGSDTDKTNELNTSVALNGTDLEVTDAGGKITTDLSSLIDDADADPTNELNTSVTLNGADLEVTDGGGTITTDLSSLIDDADADPANEIQTLSGVLAEGNDGNAIQIKNIADPTDEQDVVTKSFMDSMIIITGETSRLLAAGYSVKKLFAYGHTVSELFDAGVLVGTLEQNGASEQDLTDAGLIGTLSDADGQSYKWVKIGTQVWMAENLAYLPSVVGPGTGSETTPCYYVHGYDGTDVAEAKTTANYTTYGVLYNWTAAMAGSASSAANPSGVQGVCPTGWHLPSQAEWRTLTDYLGGAYMAAGSKLKEKGTSHWYSPNADATNESGFTALPGSYLKNNGVFYTIGYKGYWWNATENGSRWAGSHGVGASHTKVYWNSYNKDYGYSVRCIRD